MNTQTQTNVQNLSATYLVNTTNSATIPAGMVQLSANQRETKDFKPTDEQRYRNVLIRELSLPQVEERLRPIMLTKLYELAKEQFEVTMEQSNRMATTVNQEDYTLEGILKFYSTDAKSGRMTKESILEWFDASATKQFINSKNSGAVQGYRTNYAKFASPNHGVNTNTCTALLAVIQPGDLNDPIVKAIVNKMQATIEKANSSMVAAL